jgi:flagellar FliL protein
MAQEDDLDLDVDGLDDQEPKSKSKMLIIMLVGVLLLGVSGAATLMLTGVLSDDEGVVAEQADGSATADKSAGSNKKPKAPLNYVPLDPPFVVNFSVDTDVRFLQLTVEVGTRDPAVIGLIKEHRPAIRNSLVFLFSSQDPASLNSREGKEKLRDDTLTEIRKVMKKETGTGGVESVFFTSFVMQ